MIKEYIKEKIKIAKSNIGNSVYMEAFMLNEILKHIELLEKRDVKNHPALKEKKDE